MGVYEFTHAVTEDRSSKVLCHFDRGVICNICGNTCSPIDFLMWTLSLCIVMSRHKLTCKIEIGFLPKKPLADRLPYRKRNKKEEPDNNKLIWLRPAI